MAPTLAELQFDATFLKGYLGLPVRSRRIAVEHWAKVFTESGDDLLRKTALIKVYEDFVASTEDLGMIYFALTELGDAPADVIQHCDKFFVKEHEDAWNEELARIPEGRHLLSKLIREEDLPLPSDPNRKVIERALLKLTNALRAAAATRVIGERSLVRGWNKIKHGMLILDFGEDVAIDATRPERSRLPVTQDSIERLSSATVAMRQVTAVLVSVLIRKMHLAAVRNDYALNEAESQVLLESFAQIPPPFES
jgi:hypothetical protein